ncbi:hypothetical protein Q3G72_022264 [Acer saccharum]|nr:hypothetical protein Q3G72_022264 [Acer saccharum]
MLLVGDLLPKFTGGLMASQSVWEIRNDMVFNQGAADFDRVIEMVKWRAAGWFKHFGPGSKCSVAILMMNLKVGCVDSSKVKRMVKCGWQPPMVGSLKFNVDRSSRGNSGLSGIGGVLRNSDGDIVCLFSAPISFGSAMDSKAAVSYVNGAGDVGNLMIRECILDIKEILLSCKPRLSVKVTSRGSNVAADFLANQGVQSGLVQEAWV